MSAERSPGREKIIEHARAELKGWPAKDRKLAYYRLSDLGFAPANWRPDQLAEAVARWYLAENPAAEQQVGLQEVSQRMRNLELEAMG